MNAFAFSCIIAFLLLSTRKASLYKHTMFVLYTLPPMPKWFTLLPLNLADFAMGILSICTLTCNFRSYAISWKEKFRSRGFAENWTKNVMPWRVSTGTVCHLPNITLFCVQEYVTKRSTYFVACIPPTAQA